MTDTIKLIMLVPIIMLWKIFMNLSDGCENLIDKVMNSTTIQPIVQDRLHTDLINRMKDLYKDINTENLITAYLENMSRHMEAEKRWLQHIFDKEEAAFLEYCKVYHPSITKERLDRMKIFQ